MPQFGENETLQFLADVNVEKTIIDFLRQFGYLVQSVAELSTSMLDEDILNYAQRNNFILITNDKDFGEFVFRQKKMTKGIILFRFENQKAIEKITAIQFVLEHHQDKIANHFVVLSPKKVRFIPFGGSYMREDLLKRIETNPKVMLGKPVIRGTRLTVEIILEKLSSGMTPEEIQMEYPFIQAGDIRAALLYASEFLSLTGEYTIN